jgi:hypothetical protein
MDNRIEVSDELKQLYKILKSLDNNENLNNYHYVRFLVREGGGRDYMYLLLEVLKKMESRGYKFD